MVMSFGFSHGAPSKTDKTFDVRTLTHSTSSPEFLQKFAEVVQFGRENPGATIGIGCEHGQHRSVVLANKAATALRTSVYHRDYGSRKR